MAIKNFMKRLQSTPKIKSIKRKIKDNESKRKKLSREYTSALKSEGRRLSKSNKSKSRSKKKAR